MNTKQEKLSSISNIKNALIINAFKNGWFMSGSWLFFWLRFLSYSEIGLADGLTVLIAFLLEIPFGALADLIGRKKLLTLAYISMTIGPFMMGLTTSKELLLLGNFFFLIGYSAQSGAFDAIAYDSLKEVKREKEYSRYYATATTIGWIVNAFSLIIGGITFGINERIPFILWGLSYAFGLIFTTRLHEPPTENKGKFSMMKYVKQNIDGVKELFSKYLRKFLPFTIVVLGFLYFYDWSSLRPAIGKENNLDSLAQSLLYAFSSIPAALIVQSIPYFKKRISDKAGSVILCFMLAFMYGLFALPLGHWNAIPMVLINSISALSFAWMNVIINDNVDTEHRATAVSSMYMLLKVPYVLLAVIGGSIIQEGNIKGLNLVIALVIVAAALILLFQKSDKPKYS